MEEWTVETSDYKYAHCTLWKGREGDAEAKIELWEYSRDNHEVVIRINPNSIRRIRVIDDKQNVLLDTGEDYAGERLEERKAFGGSVVISESGAYLER